MIITHAALALHIKKTLAPLYIVSGKDPFLQDSCIQSLKNACKIDYEQKKLTLQISKDWDKLIETANSYALFTDLVIIDAILDKKTLDAHAKNTLQTYLTSPNSKCLIIIRAPEIPFKQWQDLEMHPQAVIIKIQPLENQAFHTWIIQQLKERPITYEPQVPKYLQQCTEGNPQAVIQALEKLSLILQPDDILDMKTVAEQVLDQSAWQIFDLSRACLQGNSVKALTILRQAFETKIEPTLVLWVLTQEIKLLSQLTFHIKQGASSFKNACNQIKIWNTRMALYEKMHTRLSPVLCDHLFQICKQLDERIKTGQNKTIWQQFESIALTLCLGQPGGTLCPI